MPDDKLLGEKVQCYISDDSDDEGDGTGFVRMTNTATAQHNPEMPQTGPKGVLADYKEFQKTGEMRGPLPKDASHNPSDDSDFNFSDEEEIFSSYRDTRFAQFNEECQRNETMLESQRDSARRFEYKKLIWSENVAELDRKNYVKHVEASGHVITLLYDAFDEHSIVTNKAINQLAKELPHVKFCRAEHKVILDSCSDLLANEGLPCVIGNFNGNQIGAIVWPEIAYELGENFLPEQLLSLLRERTFI